MKLVIYELNVEAYPKSLGTKDIHAVKNYQLSVHARNAHHARRVALEHIWGEGLYALSFQELLGGDHES